MIKERLGLLLGDSYVKVNKSDVGVLMQTMWLSRSPAEFEKSNETVSLDTTLARIKSLLRKEGKDIQTILLCAAVGTYLLRGKPE